MNPLPRFDMLLNDESPPCTSCATPLPQGALVWMRPVSTPPRKGRNDVVCAACSSRILVPIFLAEAAQDRVKHLGATPSPAHAMREARVRGIVTFALARHERGEMPDRGFTADWILSEVRGLAEDEIVDALFRLAALLARSSTPSAHVRTSDAEDELTEGRPS